MRPPKNIKQLRDDLLLVYTKQRNGEVTPAEVRETNNTARTIVSSCKVQLEYSRLKGEPPHVSFLDVQE